jgi:hypothetical protein
MQLEANERLTWQNERLSLTPERRSVRPGLGFPFGRFVPAVTVPFSDIRDEARPILDGCVTGSTNVRQSLWNRPPRGVVPEARVGQASGAPLRASR